MSPSPQRESRRHTGRLVLVVLAAFALGLAIGALGMLPRWLKHRAAARRGSHGHASSVLDPGASSHHGL